MHNAPIDPGEPGIRVADVLLGAGAGAWDLVSWAGRPLGAAAGALLGAVSTVVKESSGPGRVLAGLADRGVQVRVELEAATTSVVRRFAQPILDTVLDGVDLTALVRERVDLAGIATEVIDAVDLPEIVRSSTGTLATEAVRSIRTQSLHADDAVAGLVDRLLLRRRGTVPPSPLVPPPVLLPAGAPPDATPPAVTRGAVAPPVRNPPAVRPRAVGPVEP